jgi:1,4-alpha-glucan branching enzyme
MIITALFASARANAMRRSHPSPLATNGMYSPLRNRLGSSCRRRRSAATTCCLSRPVCHSSASLKVRFVFSLAEGFVFQGEHMPYRGGVRGKPSTDLPPTAFISFVQNHDQIGNRPLGDRMVTYRPLEPIKAASAVYLLSPQVPMLFMGEEWGAREPFPYFCDFDEDLNEKVRKGRREGAVASARF